MPNAVHKCLGYKHTYSGGIAHYARMYVSDAVLIEIGKRQRLQMPEAFVAQVSVNTDLYLSCKKCGKIVYYRRNY